MRNLFLRTLSKLYVYKCNLRAYCFRTFMEMDIHPTAHIASRVKLDRNNPRGIHIAEYTHIGSGTIILTHDFVRAMYADTRIGNHCFIGIQSIIMPGVSIGDHVIIGAGSVVTQDIPSHSIAAGNPAKVIRTHGDLDKLGQLPLAERQKRVAKKSAQ